MNKKMYLISVQFNKKWILKKWDMKDTLFDITANQISQPVIHTYLIFD